MKLKIGNQQVELTTLISISTVVIVLLSYFNIVALYGLFGINIISFLDPSEIIFSATSLFMIFLIIGINFIFLDWILTSLKNAPIKQGSNLKWIKVRTVLLSVLIILAITGTSILFLLMIGIDFNGIDKLLLLVFLVSIKSQKFSLKTKIILSLFLVVSVMSGRNVRYRDRVQNNIPEYHVEFKTDKYYLKSDSTLLYIGSTKNFVFFWDTKELGAKVYSTSNLEWIIMKKNKHFSL